MKIVPLTLREANDFVDKHHRHSARTSNDGGKYAIGLLHAGELVGVAIVGRPVARLLQEDGAAELLRCCTCPGAPKGAESKLNTRAKRIWQLMGGTRWHTYTLIRESRASIRGTFGPNRCEPAAVVRGRRWDTPSRPRSARAIEAEDKLRWDWALPEVPV